MAKGIFVFLEQTVPLLTLTLVPPAAAPVLAMAVFWKTLEITHSSCGNKLKFVKELNMYIVVRKSMLRSLREREWRFRNQGVKARIEGNVHWTLQWLSKYSFTEIFLLYNIS